jgi:hypothetical protein
MPRLADGHARSPAPRVTKTCVPEEEEEEEEEERAGQEEEEPFQEEEDLDAFEDNAILQDILRNIRHPQSTGNRYGDDMRLWAFELLYTCGIKGLALSRRRNLLPSRKSLSRNPPAGSEWSDSTYISLVLDRVQKWHTAMGKEANLHSTVFPRCILACDARACKPSVEVTPDGLLGFHSNDFDFDCDLLESLTSSPDAFRDFVHRHWDRMLTAAFVFQIQPLDPRLRPFLTFAQPARDGKAREEQAD